ncbi:MAG: alpha/beta fold hydrolase [Acidimicrobiales bacterium]|nr:alpha/beta fold hydrolase [Acidimicrobiales bacterium]
MTTSEEPIHLEIAEQGAGPSVVLTHGWVDDRHTWDGTVAALSGDHHCITWDLRGHGDSAAPPPGQYTRDDALADLTRVVESADTPCVLGGHSLGGYLSLAYTLLHPDHVRGLVLVAAGPGFRNPDTMAQWNESVDTSAADLQIPPGSEAISKHVDSWVIDNLDHITVPTLVVIGEHDKRFKASVGVFERDLDVRSTVVVPDAGHRVHVKHGAALADAIRAFTAEL